MVLKIEKPDNDFNKLYKDLDFISVLKYINPQGNYMQPELDTNTNGKLKFFGLCTSSQRNKYDFSDNIVPETERSKKFGIRRLQFLLFKHGYHDASFRIFISSNTSRPYVAIESEKEMKYYPLREAELNNSERINIDTPNDPNAPRPKPIGFPPVGYNSPGFANRWLANEGK